MIRARKCSSISSLRCFAVTLANVTVTNQFFSAVTEESQHFIDDPVDGLLGLAFQEVSSLDQVRPRNSDLAFPHH